MDNNFVIMAKGVAEKLKEFSSAKDKRSILLKEKILQLLKGER